MAQETQRVGRGSRPYGGLIRICMLDGGAQIGVMAGRSAATAKVWRFRNPFFRWDTSKGGPKP